jgi:hypothetical protein
VCSSDLSGDIGGFVVSLQLPFVRRGHLSLNLGVVALYRRARSVKGSRRLKRQLTVGESLFLVIELNVARVDPRFPLVRDLVALVGKSLPLVGDSPRSSSAASDSAIQACARAHAVPEGES